MQHARDYMGENEENNSPRRESTEDGLSMFFFSFSLYDSGL